MLTPAQLATVGLGCKWNVNKIHIPQPLPMATPPLPAWSRVTGAQRVTGGNLIYGSCVPTACCNAVVNAEARKGHLIRVPNSEALRVYSAVTGFNPDDPATDQGTDPEVMWQWWQNNEIAGYKLKSALPIDPQNEAVLRKAIEVFPAVAIVMALALEQQNQVAFMPVGTPGSWGYHCTANDGFDGSYTWGSSWGHAQAMDRSFVSDPARVVAAWGLELI